MNPAGQLCCVHATASEEQSPWHGGMSHEFSRCEPEGHQVRSPYAIPANPEGLPFATRPASLRYLTDAEVRSGSRMISSNLATKPEGVSPVQRKIPVW